MPEDVLKELFQFQHELPENFTLTPHPYDPPVYGKKVQITTQQINVPPLPKEDNIRVRQVVGFLSM